MYLLGRMLFRRRVAAAFAAFFVAFDGLCIVDSRIAVIDIHYVTWGGRGLRQHDLPGAQAAVRARLDADLDRRADRPLGRRQALHPVLQLPARARHAVRDARTTSRSGAGLAPLRYAIFPVLIVGATASTIYVLTFLPHFLWGWWHSPLDLIKYIVIKVPEYQAAVAEATHPYSSKWWTLAAAAASGLVLLEGSGPVAGDGGRHLGLGQSAGLVGGAAGADPVHLVRGARAASRAGVRRRRLGDPPRAVGRTSAGRSSCTTTCRRCCSRSSRCRGRSTASGTARAARSSAASSAPRC